MKKNKLLIKIDKIITIISIFSIGLLFLYICDITINHFIIITKQLNVLLQLIGFCISYIMIKLSYKVLNK